MKGLIADQYVMISRNGGVVTVENRFQLPPQEYVCTGDIGHHINRATLQWVLLVFRSSKNVRRNQGQHERSEVSQLSILQTLKAPNESSRNREGCPRAELKTNIRSLLPAAETSIDTRGNAHTSCGGYPVLSSSPLFENPHGSAIPRDKYLLYIPCILQKWPFWYL